MPIRLPSLLLAALACGSLACPAFAEDAAPAPKPDAAKPDAAKPAAAPDAAKPAPKPPVPTDAPSVKVGKDGQPDPGFMAKHEAFLKRGKEGPIDVLFLGDSITAGWGGGGKQVWQERYAKLNAANFGIGGDRTEHVLWRIDNGELDGIAPKVVVLMIGTNNSGNSAENILKGDRAIIERIHAKLPQAKLLLLAIFPRGDDPKKPPVAALRGKLAEVNTALAKLDDGKQTRYLDIGPKFLDPQGVLTKEIMPDALHPNAKGYQIWGEAMQPLLDEMLK